MGVTYFSCCRVTELIIPAGVSATARGSVNGGYFAAKWCEPNYLRDFSCVSLHFKTSFTWFKVPDCTNKIPLMKGTLDVINQVLIKKICKTTLIAPQAVHLEVYFFFYMTQASCYYSLPAVECERMLLTKYLMVHWTDFKLSESKHCRGFSEIMVDSTSQMLFGAFIIKRK